MITVALYNYGNDVEHGISGGFCTAVRLVGARFVRNNNNTQIAAIAPPPSTTHTPIIMGGAVYI